MPGRADQPMHRSHFEKIQGVEAETAY